MTCAVVPRSLLWGLFSLAVVYPVALCFGQSRLDAINAPLEPGPLSRLATGANRGAPRPPPTPPPAPARPLVSVQPALPAPQAPTLLVPPELVPGSGQLAPPAQDNDPYQPPADLMPDPSASSPAAGDSSWGPPTLETANGAAALGVDRRHLFGVRIGPGWYVEDTGHFVGGTPARLTLGLEYRYKLVQGSSMALHLSVPAWLQLNPDGGHESTFFGVNVGLQLEFHPKDRLALFLRASTGAGAGIYGNGQPQSLGGVLTMVGAGILLNVSWFHLGLEPLCLPLLSPIGPTPVGTQVFANLNVYSAVSW